MHLMAEIIRCHDAEGKSLLRRRISGSSRAQARLFALKQESITFPGCFYERGC